MARHLLGRLRGFLHAHMTWMIEHDYPNVAHYVPDLMAEPHAACRQPPLLHLGRARIADTRGDRRAGDRHAVGRAVRISVGRRRADVRGRAIDVGDQFGACTRSARRPFVTRDDNSRNLGIMALLAWGEGWHNNHHAFPYSAAFGLRWYEFDPGFLFIRLLEALGLAWNVKVPSAEKIALRRTHAEAARELISSADSAIPPDAGS